MARASQELLNALESDCAHSLEQVIKHRKQEDLEALRTFLSLDSSINPVHRAKAIYALGRWSDPDAVVSIRSILPHLDESGRLTAIDALGWLGTKEALEAILEYSNDASSSIRKFVTHALGKINTSEAQAKLKEIAAKDPVDYIRALAGKYLGSKR